MADQANSGDGGDSAAQEPGMELVFVYGSLKSGMANHHRLAGAGCLGPAQLQGWALYDLGPFPMAIASGDPAHTLHGELYAVSTDLLACLDRFEGVPRLYDRVCWQCADGRLAWLYAGQPRQVRFVRRIPAGIWPANTLQQAGETAELRCRN